MVLCRHIQDIYEQIDMRHKSLTVTQAAIEALEKAKKPLHYLEITKRIVHLCDLRSRTPDQTVCARVSTHPRFKRVAEGVYALREWNNYPEVRFAKDIAHSILRQRGQLMSIGDLGKKIFQERVFGNSPSAVVRGIARTDKRFRLLEKTKMIGLVEWER